MTWANQLDECSFRGVAFAFQSLDDEVTRRLVEHKFPYRSGSEFEDLGAEARVTRIRAVFMGPEYEGDLGALLKAVDAGTAGRFVHPILGSWQARVRRSPVQHSHERYSMATVDLEVVEDGADAEIPDLSTISALEVEAEEACLEVEELNTSVLDDVIAAVEAARDFVSEVQSYVNQATALVNSVRKKIETAIRTVRAIADVSNWPLTRSLKKLARSVTRLGERVRQLQPSVILKTISTAMPLAVLAHRLFGDGTARADEILRMNRIRNPFVIPAGTQLKVPSR
jgi:prophage DNA circulation protein